MQAHQMRVIEEAKELYVKLLKLREFLRGELWKSLPQEEKQRLVKQLDAMENYHNILVERIGEF